MRGGALVLLLSGVVFTVGGADAQTGRAWARPIAGGSDPALEIVCEGIPGRYDGAIAACGVFAGGRAVPGADGLARVQGGAMRVEAAPVGGALPPGVYAVRAWVFEGPPGEPGEPLAGGELRVGTEAERREADRAALGRLAARVAAIEALHAEAAGLLDVARSGTEEAGPAILRWRQRGPGWFSDLGAVRADSIAALGGWPAPRYLHSNGLVLQALEIERAWLRRRCEADGIPCPDPVPVLAIEVAALPLELLVPLREERLEAAASAFREGIPTREEALALLGECERLRQDLSWPPGVEASDRPPGPESWEGWEAAAAALDAQAARFARSAEFRDATGASASWMAEAVLALRSLGVLLRAAPGTPGDDPSSVALDARFTGALSAAREDLSGRLR